MPDPISQQGHGPAVGKAARSIVSRTDIDVALGYIERHACDGLTPMRVVAETQKITLEMFHPHFLAATGLTLEAAIRLRQLNEVRRLILRTELSPQFIAEQCGFPDIRSAARAFTAAGCEVPHVLRESTPSSTSISSGETRGNDNPG
ncbi:AraC family transcriptional regulator [Luteolibacter sp.]|uniref:AraC family transcriptional regulator n=1 Tax=Luteolibacter sp. TaxID=1962973 RepID=UPI003267F15C